MTNDRRPLHEEIEQCLDELARAHGPVVEWIDDGMRWLDEGQVSHRGLSKAERNCTRHLAALQDNKDILRAMEAKYPAFSASFVEARAGVDGVTRRLQDFLKRIRACEDVVQDAPLYVVHAPIEELSDVVDAFTALVQQQEQDFAFFNMSPEFMDSALLHAELDTIEDGCEECEGLADALEAKVSGWWSAANPQQVHLLKVCQGLVQRLRFAQASKRQAVAKLRESTAEAVIAVKLRKLSDDAGEPLGHRLH